MSVLRNVADAVLRGIGAEARYRREHPCETADLFEQRAQFWDGLGRPVLASIARRRAARWQLRCRSSGKDC